MSGWLSAIDLLQRNRLRCEERPELEQPLLERAILELADRLESAEKELADIVQATGYVPIRESGDRSCPPEHRIDDRLCRLEEAVALGKDGAK